LEGLAAVAAELGQGQKAARLLGAAQALRRSIGAAVKPSEHEHYERYLDIARAQVSRDAFEAAWAEGRDMALEEVISYALADSG
jgi:hypothetical protein